MNTQDWSTLSNEQLVERFRKLSIDQFDAELGSDTRRIVRFSRQMIAAGNALEARGPAALRMLLPLLNHQNAQVRLNAAIKLKLVERERATATLKALAERGPSAQRGAAGMSLYCDEKGISKASRLWSKARTPE